MGDGLRYCGTTRLIGSLIVPDGMLERISEMTSLRSLPRSYRVHFIGATKAEWAPLRDALVQLGGSLDIEATSTSQAKDAALPTISVHAIVFTESGLLQATQEDADVVRASTMLGTCRVYTLETSSASPSGRTSLIDDVVQRTAARSVDDLADEIITFFREANSLNRISAILGLRDSLSIGSYQALKLLWPLSYIFSAWLVFNGVNSLASGGIWPMFMAGRNAIAVAAFFGAFFVVSCALTVARNLLFGVRIVGRLGPGFMLPAGVFGLVCALTAASIVTLTAEAPWIALTSLVLASSVHGVYMYARRIRGECSSLSQVHAELADVSRRGELLRRVGTQPITSYSFPFRPFRSKALFISYMHSSNWSRATAIEIHELMSGSGVHVSFDQSSIPSGVLWRQHLLRGIGQCGRFIAVLDAAAAPTDWVLAESVLAALLRKSIGHPQILIVVRSGDALDLLKTGPFGILYQDVFGLPPERRPGAAILVAENTRVSTQAIVREFEHMAPMCLLSASAALHSPSKVRARTGDVAKPSKQISIEIQRAHDSWKTSILLVELLQREGSTQGASGLLLAKSLEWLRSPDAERRSLALNLLRGLSKSQNVAFLGRKGELMATVMNVFVSDESLAVKLAAADLLGAVGVPPAFAAQLSAETKRDLIQLRSRLMREMNAAQRTYAADGLRTDVDAELSSRTSREALEHVMARVDGGE